MMRTVAAASAALGVAAAFLPGRRLVVPRTVVGTIAVATVLVPLVTWSVLQASGAPPAIAVAGGVLVAPIPRSVDRARRRRAMTRAADRWSDLLAAIRSRVAGGDPLPDATRAAGRHIAGRFAELDSGFGLSFDAHLSELRASWRDPLADRVFTTLAAASTIGGGRVDMILSHLASSIAGELQVRRAHHAALTQQRATAVVALLAPWAILGLTLATNPGAMVAYSKPTGTAIVVGGLMATVVGYALAARTARLSQPPRLFR